MHTTRSSAAAGLVEVNRLTAYAPLLLRVALGILFIVHGYMKLTNLGMATGLFGKLGFPAPGLAALVAALVEFVGGIALILGIGSRVFALLLTVEMLVALFAVKLKAGFVGGWEFELILIAALLALAITGPGAVALSRDKGSWYA